MATIVEFGFVLAVGDSPFFRVGNAIQGHLDSATYRLAGPIWIDVSDRVTAVSISRGKNRELDRYSAASANLTLRNENRDFDPLNATSPYVGNIVPRRAVRITTNGFVQFTGVINDWNLDYTVSGVSTASIQASDAFVLFAQQTLTAGTATQQLTGARVNAVLSQPTVAWPLANRTVDTGFQFVGNDVFSGNVLSYLQDVEASEQGQLFITKDGKVRFINGNSTAYSGLVIPLFSDDGTGIPYIDAAVNYGTELLFNQAQVSSGAGTATGNNTASQTTYGITQTTIKTLLAFISSVESLANFTVLKYGEPEYRFDNLTITLNELSNDNQVSVLGLELGDIIEIRFTPNGIGAPIIRYGQIINIDHTVGIDRHDITFGVGSLQFSFLVLDDTNFGNLNVNALAF